jgi:hypothetical protein
MSLIPPSRLLEGWVYWVFQPRSGSDHPSDTGGGRTEQLNGGSDIWYLSGTWGNAGATPRRVNRNIRVREGTSIFIVLASSHATPEELGNPNASDQDLIRHATAVHALWDRRNLRIDGNGEATRTEQTPHVLTPYISDGSYYSGLAKSGVVRMATVAEVFLLDSARLAQQGQQHTIELDAHSRAGDPGRGEPNEPEYVVNASYNITVQPRSPRP